MHGLEVTELIDFDHVDDSDDQIFLLCDNFYDQLNAAGYDWVSEFDRLAERFPKTVWLFWTFHNVLYKHYWKPQRPFPFKKVAFNWRILTEVLNMERDIFQNIIVPT